MFSITLQSTDNVIVADDTVGQIQFAASSESDGGAAIAIAGGIYCKAEGSFQSASNPTSIVIATAAADSSAAVDRVKVSKDGHFLPVTNNTYDLGSSSLNFKNSYISEGVVLASNTPSVTTNKLYNEGGTLKFNGSAVGGGGGGTPGGSDTQVQFNDGGSFGGDADLVWNKTTNELTINGSLNATTKSFLIEHPSKPDMKLQYASLEGPENGVYVRGTTDTSFIKLPDYWRDLVHNDSITVTLTPIDSFQGLYVKSKSNKEILVGGICGKYDYVVWGERKDVDKLKVEW